MAKQRRVFEQGHHRKFLVVVDDSPEVESALFYAALRISHTSGRLLLLYITVTFEFRDRWMLCHCDQLKTDELPGMLAWAQSVRERLPAVLTEFYGR